jgi:hypothetical protein
MKVGELKSKIENQLVESYKKNLFKENIFIFEELVLKNKNIAKLFFLYDELSNKKGLSENVANEFINESIVAYENLINKVNPLHLRELNAWVGHQKCENNYEKIDNLFSTSVLTLENKIKSKKMILEGLTQKENKTNEVIKVPLKSMVSVANKTISKFISSLTESERKELNVILNTPKETLIENYNSQKEDVISKLEDQKNNETDSETISTINQVLTRLQTESFSELNYYKLKQLNEGL